MSKEICITSTPHETRLAIIENDELTEIYYERENEYTLAGSIYKGKVTRVLPGMQSAFVDIGLERDAFLYVTDFLEEQDGGADFDRVGGGQQQGRREKSEPREAREEGQESRSEQREGREGRGRRDRNEGRNRQQQQQPQEIVLEAQPVEAVSPQEGREGDEGEESPSGTRRWRGRRGRRRGGFRGREGQTEQQAAEPGEITAIEIESPEAVAESIEEESVILPEHGAPGGIPASNRILLPGESLGKYGMTPAPAAEKTEAKVEAKAAPAFKVNYVAPKPSTLIDAEIAWDGSSFLLPGESRSVRKPAAEAAPAVEAPVTEEDKKEIEQQADEIFAEALHAVPVADIEVAEQDADRPAVVPAAEPEATVEAVPEAHAVTEPVALVHEEEEASAAGSVVEEQQPEVAEIQVAESLAEAEIEHEEETHEFEPESGSASFRVDPAAPSEFRIASVDEEAHPVEATEAEAHVELEAAHAELETEEVEYVEQAGEAVAAAPAEVAEQAIEVEYQEEDSEEDEPASEYQESEQETDLVVEGAHEHHDHAGHDHEHSHEESLHEAAADAAHEAAEAAAQTPFGFTPGAGVLEEEVIDEDEFDFEPIHAHHDEHDAEDLEEETLEQSGAEIGDLVRDAHLVQRLSGEPEIEEEDADEAEYGEIAIEEEGEEEEGEEPEAEAGSTEQGGERKENERRGRRDNRRGRGRQGGNNRGRQGGRGRQSMQTTDLPIITDLLKQGQEILVQIAKEPIAKKGARITSHIALPGRFLVFMPTVNHVGVSRKISSDEERQRLKRILISEKGEASGGFIVRTAADGASEEELRADLRFLISLWTEIKSREEASKSPALIYHDLNLVERVLRDQVSDNFSAIWVDNEVEYERIVRFLNRFQPSLVRRVKLYSKETPLFEQFGIQDEISKALKSKVWLKSGGSIVINQTEALVAIDINTGKYVGKTARLEDTILKTNLDAIPEIVRQIRLRDLGGIIVIDFIDMDERKNRHKVMAALEEALKADRAPSKVLQFNDFGLVAITRKRVKQSLERTLSVPCNICTGTGMVKSPTTVANEIYIELRKMNKHFERGDVMLRVHPEVVKTLKASNAKWINEMEELIGRTIIIKSDPALHPEQFDIH
ncbi:Rne/Rng family ribonuclease [Silvibacterium sp.]|uniref:Rne/Rng family ribonuclease n=1 Tax=Silvibacterium sp. TaxID=1964179 RepID=UPI0039E3FCC9